MQCRDKATTYLHGLGYSVVRHPTAGLVPLTLIGRQNGTTHTLGPLDRLITNPPGELPVVGPETPAADINGQSSSSLAIGIGANVLGNLIGAMGGNLGASARYTNARRIEFRFVNVVTRSVAPLDVGHYLRDAEVDARNLILEQYVLGRGELFIATRVAYSNEFTVAYTRQDGSAAEVDVPLVNGLVGGNVTVEASSSDASLVTFRGGRRLAFGFQCFRVGVEDGDLDLYAARPDRVSFEAGAAVGSAGASGSGEPEPEPEVLREEGEPFVDLAESPRFGEQSAAMSILLGSRGPEAPDSGEGFRYAELDDLTDAQVQQFKLEAEAMTEEVVSGPDAMADGAEAMLFGFARQEKPLVVAEGDSWFDFPPGTDIIDCLRGHHGLRIKNVADSGDTLENMILGSEYGSSYSPRPSPFVTALGLLKEHQPKCFLFSGGGNDIVGDELRTYLNHAASGRRPLRDELVDEIFDYFALLLRQMIERVREVSPGTHIVTHGYGHPVASGLGVKVLFFKFAGPWIRPAFASKGYFNVTANTRIVAQLVDRWNDRLQNLDGEFEQFHYVNLRPLLSPTRDWRDELHLRSSAYARCADALIERMRGEGLV